jgi:tRNA pseudouridine55 synthase
MDGALLLDKPLGLSSNTALQRAKRLFGARKAGHAGTLDPLASGLLLVLFGEATKFAGPLLDADKEYLATLKLGERTSTGDAEGEIVERRPVEVSEAQLGAAISRFHGVIEQIPPMYSALKRGGVPLYKLARRGEEVERLPRRVTIFSIEVTRRDLPLLELRVRCSKGTYVRTLAEDLAVAMGTAAHLTALRRTGSGRFAIADAVTLDALEGMPAGDRPTRLVPLRGLLTGFPPARLDSLAEARFRNGQVLELPELGQGEGVRAVYGPQGAVIGLGMADGQGRLRPVRLTATQAAE